MQSFIAIMALISLLVTGCNDAEFSGSNKPGPKDSRGQDVISKGKDLLAENDVPPTASILANGSDKPDPVPYDSEATITWTSEHADSCTITPIDDHQLAGEFVAENIIEEITFTIHCSNQAGTVEDSVTVAVATDPEINGEIDVPITFQRMQGMAADLNCISLQINENPAVEVGCVNRDSALTNSVVELKAKAKPHCNVIRMVFSTPILSPWNTSEVDALGMPTRVRWGASASIISWSGFKLFYPTAGSVDTIEAHVNDNADDRDHIDTRFRLSGLSEIDYTIENSGQSCQP